jgi:hypothetical protein
MEQGNNQQEIPQKKGQTLGTYLGLRDRVTTVYKNAVVQTTKTVQKNQGIFKGEKGTHVGTDGYFDDTSKQKYKLVQSTVKEQLDWFKETMDNFMKIAFTVERTNALGGVTAPLIVEGETWGEFTSLELLRLKSVLDNSKLKELYQSLPIRSSSEIWEVTTNPDYANRPGIFENTMVKGITQTTEKEDYILEDPAAAKGAQGRTPQIASRSTRCKTGEYTYQQFSGEITNKQRAEIEKRYETLQQAVIVALEEANKATVKVSTLGAKVFDYLHAPVCK